MSPMLDIQRRHAEVFRIRMGDKTANGAPRKLTDAIRITSPNRSVIDAFVEVYGGEPSEWEQQWQAYLPVTSLPVMVLPGQSLTQWWELYRKTVCERRCDGFTESLSGKPCMCPSDITERMQTRSVCRPMTRISVVCPEVAVVGAGSLVSHGMIAAETLPQSVKVAEAALERGLMVPAVLRIIVHEGKRHYVVPQLEIVGVSLNTLATGEMPTPAIAPQQRAIGSGGGVSPAAPPTSVPKAAPVRSLPPLPGEETVPCPECAAYFGTTKIDVAAHLVDVHGWTVENGKVKPSDDSSTGPTGALPAPTEPNDGEHDSPAGVGPSPTVPTVVDAAGGGEAQGAPVAPPPAAPRRSKQTTALMATATSRFPDRQERVDWGSDTLGRHITTFTGLSAQDEKVLLDALGQLGVGA